ncbi:hypothetical protein [Granulicella sp. WH15]|uniref:hypothetical protein n=1 Tax=Granulicella sp. WH15 TaxID=2602070 RepID=UPI0013A54605|nr:hypothetical protein [Granulicella sp. WH15]
MLGLFGVLFVGLDGVGELRAGTGHELVHHPGSDETARYSGEDAANGMLFRLHDVSP